MSKILLYACTQLCLFTICLMVAVSVSPSWTTMYIHPRLVMGILSSSTESTAYEESQQTLDAAGAGLLVCSGITKLSVNIGPAAYSMKFKVTMEGGFVVVGLALFSLGSLLLFASSFVVKKNNPNNIPATKVLLRGASIFLLIGSAIMNVGMILFTIGHVNEETSKTDFTEFTGAISNIVGEPGEPSEINETINGLLPSLISLKINFGWCFFMGWLGGVFSMICAIIAWFVSGEIGDRYDFQHVQGKV